MLRALGESKEGATVAQLSSATMLDRAVLYRLLDTLVELGFVARDRSSRRYHLGVALVELGARAGQGLEVRRLATTAMRQLMEATKEAVCLAVRDRDDLVVVDRIEPAGLFVRIGYSVGFRHPVTVGAHGRALVAFLDAESSERALKQVEDRVSMDAELEAVREAGFAVSTDELEMGASGVAAPILDRNGHAVASMGVVAPTPRLADPAALGPRTAQAAADVSRRLGYLLG